MSRGAFGTLTMSCARPSDIGWMRTCLDSRLIFPQTVLGCIAKEGGIADDGTSVSSEEGDEGSADESVSEGSADSEGGLPSSMDNGSSRDEYEQFLSQFLGDDEPGRKKRQKG